MSSCIFPLSNAFTRMSLVKPLTPSLYHPFKRYNQASKLGHKDIGQERAPSTAEEFQRVAEEKLHEAERGSASQDFDKACDRAQESTTNLDEHKIENVENKYTHRDEPNANYRRS